MYLFVVFPCAMQVAAPLADAQPGRRAEREGVGLSDVPRGAFPCEAVFASPWEPELLRAGLLGPSSELV